MGFFLPRFNHLLCNEIHRFFHVGDASLRIGWGWMVGVDSEDWMICWEDLEESVAKIHYQGEIAMNWILH